MNNKGASKAAGFCFPLFIRGMSGMVTRQVACERWLRTHSPFCLLPRPIVVVCTTWRHTVYTVLYSSILSCQYIGLPTASKVSVHRMWCRLGRPCQTSMSKQPDAEHCPEWLQRVLVGPSRCLRVTSLVWLARLRTNKPVTWTYGPGTDCLCVTQLELCLARSSEHDTGLNAQTAGHPQMLCA